MKILRYMTPRHSNIHCCANTTINTHAVGEKKKEEYQQLNSEMIPWPGKNGQHHTGAHAETEHFLVKLMS